MDMSPENHTVSGLGFLSPDSVLVLGLDFSCMESVEPQLHTDTHPK